MTRKYIKLQVLLGNGDIEEYNFNVDHIIAYSNDMIMLSTGEEFTVKENANWQNKIEVLSK